MGRQSAGIQKEDQREYINFGRGRMVQLEVKPEKGNISLSQKDFV